MVTTTRRAVIAAGLALAGGCAIVEPDPAVPPQPLPPPPGGRGNAAPLLTPWLTLTGGWRAPSPTVPGTPPSAAQAVLPARVNWQLPVGVAAQGDQVYVLDAGWRQLFRLQRARDAVTPLGSYGAAVAADHAVSMQVGADGSVWLAEPLARRVVQLDSAGRVRRELRDERLVSRPVAVALPVAGGDVYVADATEARIAVFDTFGRAHGRFGDGVLQSVSAMAFGPQGLLVLDRLARQVVVFGPGGQAIGSFGDEGLIQPRALAVDAAGRVFVGDDGDQRIKVFAGGALVGRHGGAGGGPGRFGRIDALAVDGPQLVVADSVNQRVQVLLVAAESLRTGGAG